MKHEIELDFSSIPNIKSKWIENLNKKERKALIKILKILEKSGIENIELSYKKERKGMNIK